MIEWCGNDCPGKGFCPIFKINMVESWMKLCQTRLEYRELWKKGDGPGQKGAVVPSGSTVQLLPNPDRVKTHRNQFRESVLERIQPLSSPEKKTAEERLTLCLSCPSLQQHDGVGIYCKNHSSGCSGNWSIVLAKNITGELQHKPCKPWLDAGLVVTAKEDRQAVDNWITALPLVDHPPA